MLRALLGVAPLAPPGLIDDGYGCGLCSGFGLGDGVEVAGLADGGVGVEGVVVEDDGEAIAGGLVEEVAFGAEGVERGDVVGGEPGGGEVGGGGDDVAGEEDAARAAVGGGDADGDLAGGVSVV